jgi:hypothetical protein
MRVLLTSATILAAGLAFSGPVAAQPMGYTEPSVIASQPVPDSGTAGIPGPEAVNPAPGATGPYVGAGPHGFYDVDARLDAVAGRIASLPPGQRRRASAQIHQIRAEEATQRARHGGELRDWDRENMTQKLDQLVQQFPMLRADAS